VPSNVNGKSAVPYLNIIHVAVRAGIMKKAVVRKMIANFVLAFGGIVLGGCATKTKVDSVLVEENLYYWGVNTYLARNMKPVRENPEAYCTPANDKTTARLSRRIDAAMLFGQFVQAGYSSQQMRRAIPDPQWLNECSLATAPLR